MIVTDLSKSFHPVPKESCRKSSRNRSNKTKK
jgi:hypothetical protein